MTFRHATLIHKRDTRQQRRIITPGVALATAALVAVVLFLATAEAARAESPPESPSQPPACDGLMPITLTPSTAGTVRGASVTPSASCELEIGLSALPTPPAGAQQAETQPCVVTARPSAVGDSGVRVMVTHRGDCDGVEARWTVRPSGSATNSVTTATAGTGASGASSTGADAYALLEAYDNEVLKILMFENKSRAYWVSTPTSVLRARHYPSQRGYPTIIGGEYLGDGWSVTHAFPQLTALSDSLYEASNSANFTIHVPRLPDPSAQTRADLYLLPSGLFSCDFAGTWRNPYPGFHFDTYCRFTP